MACSKQPIKNQPDHTRSVVGWQTRPQFDTERIRFTHPFCPASKTSVFSRTASRPGLGIRYTEMTEPSMCTSSGFAQKLQRTNSLFFTPSGALAIDLTRQMVPLHENQVFVSATDKPRQRHCHCLSNHKLVVLPLR